MENPLDLPIVGGSVLVSPESEDIVRAHKWRIRQSADSPIRYAIATIDGRTVYLHRLIAQPADGLVVDHINHDGLDNRRENLRVCTQAQNTVNCRRSTASGFRGVQRRGNSIRSFVYNPYTKKLEYFGPFTNEIDAAIARDKRLAEHWGEYAALNFPVSA